jgi:hypothetical protein
MWKCPRRGNVYEPTEEWLEQINHEFGKQNVPHGKRPWLALMKWASHAHISFPHDSSTAKTIFAWFEKNTKAGSQRIGPLYTGTFFYDTCFWPVFILVVYGTVRLNAGDSLKTMPETPKTRLGQDQNEASQYACLWADCADYGSGIPQLTAVSGANRFAGELCRSGDQQLRAAISLLLEDTPNPKAAESARMATEMFLKAFLASKSGLTEKEAKDKIRHNIEKALAACLTAEPNSELQVIRPQIGYFPDVGDRYKGAEETPARLWRTYGIAQFIGATVVRSATGRDIRKTMSRC